MSRTRLSYLPLLLAAFALSVPDGAALARTRNAARPAGCGAEIGPRNAAGLVAQCLAVSPGRPGCAAANTCATITDEIRRGCLDAEDEDAFPFCSAFFIDRDDDAED